MGTTDKAGSTLSAQPTPLDGLFLVERQRRGDERGYLERLFCAETLHAFGWTEPVAQLNRTFTAEAGTVRGLHFQYPPHAETKLVICTAGEVFDVAVDLRAGSPTFLQWFGTVLSPERGNALLIPKGFAHGFQTLTEGVELIYVHSAAYVPTAEGGLHPQDPAIAIAWPRAIAKLSPRDASHPLVDSVFKGIER